MVNGKNYSQVTKQNSSENMKIMAVGWVKFQARLRA